MKIIHWTAIVLFCGAPLAGLLHHSAHPLWSFTMAFIIGGGAMLIVDLCAGAYDIYVRTWAQQTTMTWYLATDVRRRLDGGDGA